MAGGTTLRNEAIATGDVATPEWTDQGIDLEAIIDGIEEKLIRQAFTAADGNKSRAARLLGLNRDKFRTRFNKYDIS